jgi:hypothetical protein
VLHPPLGELSAAALGVEPDDPQVAGGLGRGAVDGLALDGRDIVSAEGQFSAVVDTSALVRHPSLLPALALEAPLAH